MKRVWPVTRYQALPHRQALLEDFLYRFSLHKWWRMPELTVKVCCGTPDKASALYLVSVLRAPSDITAELLHGALAVKACDLPTKPL